MLRRIWLNWRDDRWTLNPFSDVAWGLVHTNPGESWGKVAPEMSRPNH